MDPLLQTTNPLIRDIVSTAFAARVRTGYYGLWHRIKAQGVSDALAAISKTIKLAGLKSPLYRGPNKYTLALERCLEGMRCKVPPAVPQLALPISVLLDLVQRAYETKDPRLRAIGDLAIIAFYYLLRVGEYTKPKTTYVNGRQV